MTGEEYWDEVDQAWAAPRPEPVRAVRAGPFRGGAILAAAMIGLQEVLEPRRREEPVIEEEAGEPWLPPGSVVVRFDPASPRRTVAVLPR